MVQLFFSVNIQPLLLRLNGLTGVNLLYSGIVDNTAGEEWKHKKIQFKTQGEGALYKCKCVIG